MFQTTTRGLSRSLATPGRGNAGGYVCAPTAIRSRPVASIRMTGIIIARLKSLALPMRTVLTIFVGALIGSASLLGERSQQSEGAMLYDGACAMCHDAPAANARAPQKE